MLLRCFLFFGLIATLVGCEGVNGELETPAELSFRSEISPDAYIIVEDIILFFEEVGGLPTETITYVDETMDVEGIQVASFLIDEIGLTPTPLLTGEGYTSEQEVLLLEEFSSTESDGPIWQQVKEAMNEGGGGNPGVEASYCSRLRERTIGSLVACVRAIYHHLEDDTIRGECGDARNNLDDFIEDCVLG